jgi:V8-like Glu-specific endopeptidase
MMAKLVRGLVGFCIAQQAYSFPTGEKEALWSLLGAASNGESEANIASIDEGLIPEFFTLDAEILRSVMESNITAVPPSAFGDAAQAEKRVIIGGVDNRVRWTDRNFPYSPIGRLENAAGGLCSATLVGPRHVATALHCIPEQGTAMTFRPAYAGGDTYPSSAVQYVLSSGVPFGAPCWEFSDWAIRKSLLVLLSMLRV